jgi:cell division protein ZapE
MFAPFFSRIRSETARPQRRSDDRQLSFRRNYVSHSQFTTVLTIRGEDSKPRTEMAPARLSDRYEIEVNRGHFERDAAQLDVIRRLEALAEALANYQPARKSGALGRIFGVKPNAIPPRGLYIWGSVGRGKTMLMDLFFDAVDVPHKRRVHFHAFMAEVHERIHAWRQMAKRGEVKGDDPIAPVAEALADEAWLLCFDEFAVTDITDAMILGRLFNALFQRGTVIVATSNVVPSELYKDGLNRTLFLPFIDLLTQKLEAVELVARTDFRLEKLQDSALYHVPADIRAQASLTQAFKALTGFEWGEPCHLTVLGRQLLVPQGRANVARFSFEDLCQKPLGSPDYLALARAFHTLVLDGIPIIEAAARNEAARFTILIDALYDQHVKLIASAAAEPDQLFRGTDGHEAFEFRRTVSRLMEMRSPDYLALPHGMAASIGSGDASGLVET